MGRQDPGMATAIDWSAHKAAVLEERNQSWPKYEGNQVFLDLVVDNKTEQTMRLVFALFLDECPLAAANFHALCSHRFEGLGESGKALSYRRCPIHRIAKGQFVQGGDIEHGTGAGGDSIYGKRGFEDESAGLRMRHNAPGLLTMANDGVPDTNVSQFMITLGEAPQLDGSHQIFGRLVSGQAHLPTLEALPLDADERPARRVTIVDCGVIPGWKRLPPPLPESSEKPADLKGLGTQAEAQRSAVAEAVATAMKKREGEGASDEPAPKRVASRGMMALPGGLDDDDDDDDEDE